MKKNRIDPRFYCIISFLLLMIYRPSVDTVAQHKRSIGPIDVPHGIYGFGLAKNFIKSASFELPYIAGMSAIFNWNDLEPIEGKYDFRLIREYLSLAAAKEKKLNLILYAGNKSPEWIYDRGVTSIAWRRRWKEDQAKLHNENYRLEKAPLFWDTIYLDYWKKLITALASEIQGHQALGYIIITGATPKDCSTGTVIRYNEDWKKILELGYTHEIHLKAWTSLIDHYIEVLPVERLVLALGPLRPGTSNLKLSEDLVTYIITRGYASISFLSVILNDTWFVTSPGAVRLRELFKYVSGKGYSFGYQMNYSIHRMNRFEDQENKTVRDMDETLKIALIDGVSWIEIWHDDIIEPSSKIRPNESFRNAIQNAADKLKYEP